MPSSPDSLLARALAAHRDGRLAEAEAGYREVLEERPEDATALYWLGLLVYHRGDPALAVQYLSRSLARAPSHVRGWTDLGGILLAGGELRQAREAYSRALEADPALAQSWYNLGIVLGKEGDLAGGIRMLREALAREPGYLRAYEPLATMLYQSGEQEAAAAIYRQWLEQDPGSPQARHLAAAATRESAPVRASDEYLRAHFDSAAGSFDTNLQQLLYRAPGLVAEALARLVRSPLPTLLDAGCGTGLCAPLLRPLCRTLIGVDLSPGMLARARERGGYDQLIEAELTAFLRAQPGTLAGIVCVDTLVYFGPLEEPLGAAAAALTAGGLLVFTLEAGRGADHQIQIHGRYTHDETYVRRSLAASGLELLAITRETLREERLASVAGHLVVARRAAPARP